MNGARTMLATAIGAGSGAAGLAASAGCSGACAGCFGCVAAGAGALLAALIGSRTTATRAAAGATAQRQGGDDTWTG